MLRTRPRPHPLSQRRAGGLFPALPSGPQTAGRRPPHPDPGHRAGSLPWRTGQRGGDDPLFAILSPSAAPGRRREPPAPGGGRRPIGGKMPAKRTIWPSRLPLYGLIAAALLLLLAIRVMAQNSGPPTLLITGVESQDFPQVTVHVAVADENGLPIVGLTEDNVQVQEGESPGDSWRRPLAVVDDSRQPLYLVLAMDLSTPAKYLAESKKAALAFLDTLGPEDQVAILAFYNQVQVLQDFTGDRAALKAVIEGLQVTGDRTTLNAAAAQAVELANSAPPGRKAVLMVTNIVDNIGDLSLDQAVAQAQAAQVPIYTIGIGPKAQANIHRDLTSRTGGHAFVVSDPAQVGINFQRAGVMMRQGYKITFLSTLTADGATHPFTLRLTYPGGEAQSGGRFRAVLGRVSLALEGLSEGQTVWGTVSLTCRVTASAPVTQVAYLLDDETVALVAEPPFRLDWDSRTTS
ncbi:MAG TPA: VWA domain-containing protein, partial [Anaerolineae bacterium]|nr:VWA domain-containing protein [Anaerolineae bacterium]